MASKQSFFYTFNYTLLTQLGGHLLCLSKYPRYVPIIRNIRLPHSFYQKCDHSVWAILEGEVSIGNSPRTVNADKFCNYILNWVNHPVLHTDNDRNIFFIQTRWEIDVYDLSTNLCQIKIIVRLYQIFTTAKELALKTTSKMICLPQRPIACEMPRGRQLFQRRFCSLRFILLDWISASVLLI